MEAKQSTPWMKRIALCLGLAMLGFAFSSPQTFPLGALGGLFVGAVIPDRMLRE